jgi:hypothetical protein
MYIMFRQTMALPIESLRPDVLVMERAERKAAVERLPATTASQQFIKDTLLMAVAVKEKLEVSTIGLYRAFRVNRAYRVYRVNRVKRVNRVNRVYKINRVNRV